jgi:hypothetical protein
MRKSDLFMIAIALMDRGDDCAHYILWRMRQGTK